MAVSRSPATVAGEVYKVGDAAAWTIGGIDYHQWASCRAFHVGDILIFEYNPEGHNVMRVGREDYKSCNTASPIATYASGNDSIRIMGPGHYYYICGFEGHCQGGQKVDIRVFKVPQPTEVPSGGSPALSPHHTVAPAPAPAPVSDISPPGPSPSGGSRRLGALRDVALLFGISVFLV
ncbi:mavicyanin-like [Ipomoea triloba]|uniref:mavicyanin-like n=1 Tax=Ipomoea triloba TaxID=35885 RepID=UPI00125D7630|nr:mavicyanin-like [Ipomoea triloba]